MGFFETGQDIRNILGKHAGIFLGGSHAWKSKGRDLDILIVLERAPSKEEWGRFMDFAKTLSGRTEWGMHGPPDVFGEVASVFVTTVKDMQKACFSDAWTARLVLLGLKPHPENKKEMNALAEDAQELAWKKFLKWVIARSGASSIEEIKRIAESDIIGSRSFSAGARWSAKKREDKVFRRHVVAKIQDGVMALVQEKEIAIEAAHIKANFKDAPPIFRNNISSSLKSADLFG